MELVSCIMPTADRPDLIRDAFVCFHRQTYENRELIILDNGVEPLRTFPSERVRYFRCEPGLTIGELRNKCVENSRGSIIAHWDDDDLSHSDRLSEQVAALRRTSAMLVGYHSMFFLDDGFRRAFLYSGTTRYALGTSFCYRKTVWLKNQYQPMAVGEDNTFLWRMDQQQIWTCDANDRMIARTHPKNTSPRLINANGSYSAADYEFVRGIAKWYSGTTDELRPEQRDAPGPDRSGSGDEPNYPSGVRSASDPTAGKPNRRRTALA